MKRNVNIIKDLNGEDIVLINDIFFKGRQNIDLDDVESYLRQYIGEIIRIVKTKDIVYIGNDFADEYTGSKHTAELKGTMARAKANAAQGIPEMVEIATWKSFKRNLADKHKKRSGYPALANSCTVKNSLLFSHIIKKIRNFVKHKISTKRQRTCIYFNVFLIYT